MASTQSQPPWGLLITFEGPDGGGKTTQVRALSSYLTARGRNVRCYSEPGGTRIGDEIRSILLAPEHEEMVPRAELLLFLASRAQLVSQEIRPGLEAGAIVLCDRYTDSTLAYQGVTSGLGVDDLERLNDVATGGLTPGLTLLLDLDVETGLRRQGEKDRMESRGVGYHQRVREAYLDLARRYPTRIRVIDAVLAPEEVAARIRALVDERLVAL